jgi:predicted AAA+ superfamily ATPase
MCSRRSAATAGSIPKVVTPREDLREGKPVDAAEFAVHLDQVRDRRGSEEYFNPIRFFERTFLTKNLSEVAGQVVRRLSGETTATSAVFNMATQFGGGKTHALTLLYYLATHGPAAKKWVGVDQILERAQVADE